MKGKVVILIFAHKSIPNWYEALAFEQCFRILGRHPIRLVCPAGLDITTYQKLAPKLKPDFIPPEWLCSVRAYNRLKILPFLYRRYAEYEYILTYELDAFVFRDELLDWCEEGWDYIGAPWFEGYYDAGHYAAPVGVGNSGFSLRRTSSMLRILRSWRYLEPPSSVIRNWRLNGRLTPGSLFLLFSRLTFRNNFLAPLNDYGENEDKFWGLFAATRFPWFRIAPYEIARKFSFEMNARRLYREIGSTLPFGCHKWAELAPDFWYPMIQSCGYTIPEAALRCPVQSFHALPV